MSRVLGERLAGTPVGPSLAAALAPVDVTAVPNGSVIDVLQACARQRAHTDGVYLGAVASVLETRVDHRAAARPDPQADHHR